MCVVLFIYSIKTVEYCVSKICSNNYFIRCNGGTGSFRLEIMSSDEEDNTTLTKEKKKKRKKLEFSGRPFV